MTRELVLLFGSVLVCFMVTPRCQAEYINGEYSRTNESLTLVPENIPDDAVLVNLSYNLITSLQQYNFFQLQKCSLLDLSRNSIFVIQERAFNGLEVLHTLVLSHNSLSRIRPWLFSKLSLMEKFYLNHNRIGQLDAGAFNGLGELQELYLGNNQLTRIRMDSFSGLDNCVHLELNSNSITQVDQDAFSHLRAIQNLNLNDNKLTSITTEMFSPLSQCLELYLSDNSMSVVQNYSFVELRFLEILHLDNNELAEVNTAMFSGLVSLLELRLRFNQIASIDLNSFAELAKLKYLNLGGNQLTELAPEMFTGLSSLKTLNLHNNRFRTIDSAVLADLPRPLNLGLIDPDNRLEEENLFQCDSKLCWLKTEEETGDIIFLVSSGGSWEPRCASGKSWNSLTCNGAGDLGPHEETTEDSEKEKTNQESGKSDVTTQSSEQATINLGNHSSNVNLIYILIPVGSAVLIFGVVIFAVIYMKRRNRTKTKNRPVEDGGYLNPVVSDIMGSTPQQRPPAPLPRDPNAGSSQEHRNSGQIQRSSTHVYCEVLDNATDGGPFQSPTEPGYTAPYAHKYPQKNPNAISGNTSQFSTRQQNKQEKDKELGEDEMYDGSNQDRNDMSSGYGWKQLDHKTYDCVEEEVGSTMEGVITDKENKRKVTKRQAIS